MFISDPPPGLGLGVEKEVAKLLVQSRHLALLTSNKFIADTTYR